MNKFNLIYDNNFQYEKLSEITDETVGIEEIDDPNMCVDREDDLG